MNRYEGFDNYGKPKQHYLDALSGMDDKELFNVCDHMIWLSSYAGNNPRSDYHWQCDACYDECIKRGKGKIYDRAYRGIETSIK